MRYIKEEDKLDINIEIRSTMNIIDQVINETKGYKNKEVLLYSELYSTDAIRNSINKNWKPEYYDYLVNNNITIKYIWSFLPEIRFERNELVLK